MNPVYICIPTTENRRERLKKCIESIHQNAGYPHVIVTYENYKEGFIKPIHTILKGLKDDTLVWCIGDDTVLTQPNTIKDLVTAFHAAFPNGDGVVNPDDGIQRGVIITMPLCKAITMRRYTFEGYFLNYADNEMTEILSAERRYAYVPSVKVDHQHHIVGKAPKDATYEAALEKFSDDQILFTARKAKGFQPRNNI